MELETLGVETASHLAVKELNFQDVMEHMKVALGECQACGLFQCIGSVTTTAPGWKWSAWGRLVHCFGVSNKFTHRHAYQQDLAGAPWRPEEATGEAEESRCPWPVNPNLPPAPKVCIPAGVPPQEVQTLGREFAGHFDWKDIAEFLGDSDKATLLHRVCSTTKWRRMQGRAVGGAPQFTCTRLGQRGAVVGPLGQDLLLAVVNLVAMNLQDEVVLLEEPRSTKAGGGEVPCGAVSLLHEKQPQKLTPQGPGARSGFTSKAALAHPRFPYFEERCQVRASYLKFLEEQLGIAEDDLSFNAILEDDVLSNAFLEARAAGINPATVLPMVLKAEGDATPGHVCYFGPKATEFFLSSLGLGYGIATVDQLLKERALPKPFTVVYHQQHWVPMWLKTVGGEHKSRPWLPVASYDLYLERYGPAAEAAEAHMDCTGLAAGCCLLHAILILQELERNMPPTCAASSRTAVKKRTPPPNENMEGWDPMVVEVWHLDNPQRVRWVKFGNTTEKAWWVLSRRGGKLGKCATAEEACKLYLTKRVDKPRHLKSWYVIRYSRVQSLENHSGTPQV